MYLPQLKGNSQSRIMTDSFLGYNARLRCSDGEFSEMKNMTGEYYPVMSPRKNRGIVKIISSPQGIASKDALIYIDGSNLVISDYSIDMGLTTDEVPKQLISMGAYLIIWPDKKYINTVDLTDYGNLEATFTSKTTVTFSMVNSNAEAYTTTSTGSTAPTSPENGDYWLDTSQTKHSLKVWSETSSMWISVATTYIKISCTGIGKLFTEGDGVTISGCTAAGTSDLNNTMVIQSVSDNYIVVIGLLDAKVTQTTAVTVARKIPTMDYVIESNNRLWGCHYGLKDGLTVNEIYASKLGDAKNWNCYAGLSTDSYSVSLGSDGPFTGAVNFRGYPLFFKENCIHKIYGSYPAQYEVQATTCRGVQKNSYRSIQIVDETLYYKSAIDICAYDGSLPVSISDALGSQHFTDAVAGALGSRYYISMKNTSGVYEMYTYDVSLGRWFKDDNTQATCFCTNEHRLFYIDSNKKLMCTSYDEDICSASEGEVEWMAATGIIGYEYPDRKYISRFNIRVKKAEETTLKVYCEYDSSGEWILQGEISGNGTDTFTIPVKPVRCDHMRIKISGTGDCKIYSITKIIEEGSDL